MRKPRLLYPDLPHHLILRGNNRRNLFSYPNDYYAFIRYLWSGALQHDCLVHALVLMTNHVHLLASASVASNLSKLVHVTSMRYAQRRNRRYGATGKLYESRFRSYPVLSDGQLAVVTAYIELNPLRAGIRTDPLEYPYSTYALHVGRGEEAAVPRQIWTPSPWFLSLGDNADERGARHRAWVEDCRAQGRRPDEVAVRKILPATGDPRIRRPSGCRAT
jgi:putative transposase